MRICKYPLDLTMLEVIKIICKEKIKGYIYILKNILNEYIKLKFLYKEEQAEEKSGLKRNGIRK
jgi:hypothetical protein